MPGTCLPIAFLPFYRQQTGFSARTWHRNSKNFYDAWRCPSLMEDVQRSLLFHSKYNAVFLTFNI